ncbi:uncharacterized protein LOC128963865 [Oppia nitens]|uniref:uncharacterized protein LOC128963865 n=1 Tax=Oppia nitens TaxID=1686743 RepID=UPI0023DA8457|nr:uncharacterized protein LOC128963865 [Oppia nitens]
MDDQSVKSNGSKKRVVTTKSTSVIPVNSNALTAAKQEEWTTSRKVVNHKTRQVETRVQRQIIMEDGKVIADSGPQVTTKTKEDQKQEESEHSNHKNTGDTDTPPAPGYKAVPGGNQVVSEKTETHNSSREAKEENIQYHDESYKELSGYDIHRKALQAPNELIQLDSDDSPNRSKGKLVHYSSKSNKINDCEEVKETSRVGRDGNVVTETTRTHHHEEFNDDEVPEEGQEQLKALPAATTETTRNIEHLKDYEHGFDNFSRAMNQQNIRSIENKKTDRWLDDHFGSSDESDIVETSNTRTGKNVINVSRTGRTSTPLSTYSRDYPSIDRTRSRTQHQRTSKMDQKYSTSANYYAKDLRSRTPSPTHDYYRPQSQMKGDASVQASLSDDEDRANDFRTTIEKRDLSSSRRVDSRSETPNRPPEKTFYFGDDNHQRREMRSDRQVIEEYIRKKKSQPMNTSSDSESKRKSDYNNNEWNRDTTGYVSANVESNVKSTVNNKVVTDSSTKENFEKSFKDWDEVETNLNRFMDWDKHYKSVKSSEEKPYWSSEPKSSGEYIHPVIQREPDDYYSSIRKDPMSRQRNFDSYVSPPPLYSNNTTSDYKYKSYSPPSSPIGGVSGGTWTKSKARTHSPLYRSSSPTGDSFPRFSPLSTNALQIKNFTEAYSNGRKHS